LIYVPAARSRRFEFKKSRQLFIRTHNEALTVATVRVSNKDRSTARIHESATRVFARESRLHVSAKTSGAWYPINSEMPKML